MFEKLYDFILGIVYDAISYYNETGNNNQLVLSVPELTTTPGKNLIVDDLSDNPGLYHISIDTSRLRQSDDVHISVRIKSAPEANLAGYINSIIDHPGKDQPIVSIETPPTFGIDIVFKQSSGRNVNIPLYITRTANVVDGRK